MYDFTEMVPEQYRDSPNLRNLFTDVLDRYIEQTATLKEIDTLTTLETAMGVNLDDLGEIIGYSRPAREPTAQGEFFAFESGTGLGYSSANTPVNGGIWQTLESRTGLELLDDTTYRYLLKLKVIRNNAKGTPDDIIGAVMALSGTVPTMVEDNANITLNIPGLTSGIINLRDLYHTFLPRPLGVSLTIEDSALPQMIFTEKYAGLNNQLNVVIAGANFDIGEWHIWIKAVDDTGPHYNVFTTASRTQAFTADSEGTLIPSDIIEIAGDTLTIQASQLINKFQVEYLVMAMPYLRKTEQWTNHNKKAYTDASDALGVNTITYTGSGENGHAIEWVKNKYSMMAAVKDLNEDGPWTVVLPQRNGLGIDINNANPPREDSELPLLEAGSLTMNEKFNTEGRRYLVWLLTYAPGNTMSRYIGDGVAGRLVAIGQDIELAIIRRVDATPDMDWIVISAQEITDPASHSAWNKDDAFTPSGMAAIDGQTITLSDAEQVNADGGDYVIITLRAQ